MWDRARTTVGRRRAGRAGAIAGVLGATIRLGRLGGLVALAALGACDVGTALGPAPDAMDATDATDVVGVDAAPDTAVLVDEGLGIAYDATSGGVVARYEPGGAGFTATPWPTDRLRRADGTVDLSGMPNPYDVDFIAQYLAYGSEAVDGYSRNGALYFELSGRVDPASLPSDVAAMNDARAPVQLVDVSEGRASYGQRLPLVFQQTDAADDPYYVGPTLALRPVYGFPLADAGTYCAFVTRALKDAGGRYLERAPAFAAALASEPTLAPLRAWLLTSPVGQDDLAAATCFTTQDATREMRRIVQALDARDVPELFDVSFVGTTTHYHELTARYLAPNFQQGVKPYTSEGGDVVFDEAGEPVVAELETIRVRILIPRNFPMPTGGWPVVLYSHGTGGDWSSCLGSSDSDVQRDGLAMLCIDQPLHGIRGVGDDDNFMNAFNFLNPRSGRMSFRQAAADTVWLARLVAAGRFDLGAAATGLAKALRFDPSRILFFGHSHGGLSGVIAFGVDTRVAGGVLSGASGVLIETILLRKDPVDIAAVVAALLGVDEAQLDTFHPVLTVAQTLVDVTDPINYAPYWLAPVDGGRAKQVFMTEGTLDAASPAVGADALAAAAGLPLVTPVVQASRAHELRALAPVSVPLTGNLTTLDGQVVTGALKQFLGGTHFVAFDAPEARALWRGFLRSFGGAGDPVLAP